MHALILYHVCRESRNRLFSICGQKHPLNTASQSKPEILYLPQSIEIFGFWQTENRIAYEIPAQSTAALFSTLEFIHSCSAVRLFVAQRVCRKQIYDMSKNSNVSNPHIFNRRASGVLRFSTWKWHKSSNENGLGDKNKILDILLGSPSSSLHFHAEKQG
jgi:hypothetical protein